MLIPKGKKPKRIKKGRIKDEKHLSNVRHMPCCCCGAAAPSQPHHLLRGVPRGMGLKASDCWVIPLCYMCHSDLHDREGNEIEFLQSWGVDGKALSLRLWRIHTGNYN